MNHRLLTDAVLYVEKNPDMLASERLLLYVLAMRADHNNVISGVDQPSLGALVGVNRNTTVRNMRKLRNAGLVKGIKRKHFGDTISYEVTIPSELKR